MCDYKFINDLSGVILSLQQSIVEATVKKKHDQVAQMTDEISRLKEQLVEEVVS